MEILFVLGIIFIAISIFVIIRNKKYEKGRHIYAVVSDCQTATMNVMSAEIPCTQITIEIPTSNGVVYKQMKHAKEFNPGDVIEIYYSDKHDTFELAENVKLNSGKGPYILMVFGIGLCLLAALLEVYENSEKYGDMAGYILVYGLCLSLILAGGYLCIYKPIRIKRQMQNCHIVKGRLTDYKKKRDCDREYKYTPMYEYYYNGQKKHLHSSVSGNGRKYRQIGREVSIVINNMTGEIFCKEDAKDGVLIGAICMIGGIITMALLLFTK